MTNPKAITASFGPSSSLDDLQPLKEAFATASSPQTPEFAFSDGAAGVVLFGLAQLLLAAFRAGAIAPDAMKAFASAETPLGKTIRTAGLTDAYSAAN